MLTILLGDFNTEVEHSGSLATVLDTEIWVSMAVRFGHE